VVKPPVVEDPKNPPRIIFPGVEVSDCKSDISKCARTTTRYESDYQYKFTTTLTSWATENVVCQNTLERPVDHSGLYD